MAFAFSFVLYQHFHHSELLLSYSKKKLEKNTGLPSSPINTTLLNALRMFYDDLASAFTPRDFSDFNEYFTPTKIRDCVGVQTKPLTLLFVAFDYGDDVFPYERKTF